MPDHLAESLLSRSRRQKLPVRYRPEIDLRVACLKGSCAPHVGP